MEITIANVADDRCQNAALLNIALGLGETFGQPRYRHANIGGHHGRART
jgi:hypothetical protein